MRYAATEKLEIIRLVEGSHLPVRRTLARIGVPSTTFYRWYDRYHEHGPEGLEDRSPRPRPGVEPRAKPPNTRFADETGAGQESIPELGEYVTTW